MKNTNTHVTAGTAMVFTDKEDHNHYCFVHSFKKGWAQISYDPNQDGTLEERSVRASALAVLTCDPTDLPDWLYDLTAPASVLQGDASFAPDNNGKADPAGLTERAQAVVDSIEEEEDLLPEGYRRFGKVRFKPVRYSATKIGKKRFYDTNDDVAEELRGYERNELAELLADILDNTDHAFWPKSLKKAWATIEDTETTVEFVLAKYGKLNEGMFRMTVGNVIRGIRNRQAEEGLMEAI